MILQSTKKLVAYALLVALFGFAVYSNIILAIRNYQFRQVVAEEKATVESMADRNEKLESLLSFYQTREYQEAEAKRRLGLRRNDENVILVRGMPENSLNDTLEDAVYREPVVEEEVMSNFDYWLRYFSGRDN